MTLITIDKNTYVSQSFNERVRFLVLHYTAENLEQSIKKLTIPNAVSAHYLISDQNPKQIFQLVAEDKRAWHAGVSAWQGRENLNDTSIGIEIVNLGYVPETQNWDERIWFPFPGEQVEAVIALAQDIVTRYAIEPTCVVGHMDIAPLRKVDPGPVFPWRALYENGVGAWPDVDMVHTKLSANLDNPETLQKKLVRYGYKLAVTGQLDAHTKTTIQAFQIHFRPAKCNGQWDIETQAILDALLEKYKR